MIIIAAFLFFTLTLVTGALITGGCAIFTHRWEYKGLLMLVPATLLYLYFLIQGFEAPFILAPFVIGACAGILFKKGKSFALYIILASSIMGAIASGSHFYMERFQNVNTAALLKEYTVKMIADSKIPAEEKKLMLEEFDSNIELIKNKMPFINFLSYLIFASFCFPLLVHFFAQRKIPLQIKGIEYFRLNDYFIFVLILNWGTVLFINAEKYAFFHTIAINCALIASVLYFIQAIGVIKFFIIKKGLPQFLIPMLFALMIMLGGGGIVFFSVLLTGFGSLDLWADFRKLNVKKNGETKATGLDN